jgi:hypothetical protein
MNAHLKRTGPAIEAALAAKTTSLSVNPPILCVQISTPTLLHATCRSRWFAPPRPADAHRERHRLGDAQRNRRLSNSTGDISKRTDELSNQRRRACLVQFLGARCEPKCIS